MMAFCACAPRFRHPKTFVLAVAFCSLTFVAGCGPDTGGRVPVSGTVTLGGEPLEQGTIEFHPTGEGTITGGTIRDGRFDIPATQGALPGEYEVRIFAADMEGAPMDDPNAPPGESDRPLQPELIDARYNTESELTAEIGESGATDLNFDLEE